MTTIANTIDFLHQRVLMKIEVMGALCSIIGVAGKVDQAMLSIEAIPKVATFMAEQLDEASEALNRVLDEFDGEPGKNPHADEVTA